MTRLNISVLGAPEITLDGHVLKFRTRKALALLVFLALEPGRHSREKLQDIFWSDSSSGLNALRGALMYVRDALGDFEPLLIERQALSLGRSSDIWVDVWSLEAVNLAGDLASLEAACALYRGEFLEGLTLTDAPEFSDWLEARRNALRDQYLHVLTRVILLHCEAGSLETAIRCARERVRVDAFNEGAYKILIELLLESENRSGALEVLQACRDRFKRDLNTVPSQELEGLLELQSKSVLSGMLPKPQTRLEDASRFVGREREFQQLEAAWEKGLLIYIAGLPGIGKSRLMREFAASRGGLFIEFSGRPGDAAVPYASYARSIRRMLELFPDVKLEPWVIAELRRIVPMLKANSVVAPASHGLGEEGKIRLHDAIAAFHVAVAPNMMGMMIDDIQYFDAASAEASIHLVSTWERFDNASGAQRFIVNFCTNEMKPELEHGIRMQAKAGMAALIELESLELPAIQTLLESKLDQRNEALGRRLYTFAGGNPLFTLETINALLESGNFQNFSITSNVQQIILDRIARLPASASVVARLAAVAGEQFSTALARTLLSENVVLEGLESLERAGIMDSEHPKETILLGAVLNSIPEGVANVLRQRIANALEQAIVS
jgi:DNA-binding SARP family transcriptional activator